ncbi:MAG: RagB/SusD family nutrient uptake outer membrane protein [Draconibacterium sp.]|nr:RagB/SusD family nutrient uptake outer membrane protein [Draconibacterium sp.]
MNKIIYLIGSVVLILITSGCDVLEKENLTAISNDDVYTIPGVAEAYVNDIYANFMPGINVDEGKTCDEAMSGTNDVVISSYLRGTITADSYDYMPYSGIRNMNIFLDGIDGATFDEATKNRLKGETLFWRAWAYFRMVRAYGGVELILKPASPKDEEAVLFPVQLPPPVLRKLSRIWMMLLDYCLILKEMEGLIKVQPWHLRVG